MAALIFTKNRWIFADIISIFKNYIIGKILYAKSISILQ